MLSTSSVNLGFMGVACWNVRFFCYMDFGESSKTCSLGMIFQLLVHFSLVFVVGKEKQFVETSFLVISQQCLVAAT